MQKYLILFFSIYFLCFGCSLSDEKLNRNFNKEYKVIDKGGSNVIVISKACSISTEKANSEAIRTAEYHLRTVIGSGPYRKKLKKIRNYSNGQKICVEILARGFKT